MKWNPFNSKLGLALGGGAAKGLAHLGVIKAIEEDGLEIHCVSGSSVGALVASYYAFGKHPDDIMSIGKTLNHRKLFSLTWKKCGLMDSSAIETMLLQDLGDRKIEDAHIPLAICTTDIITGEKVIYREGPLVPAVCASMAVPGLFVPVEIGDRLLVDGGIVENVPISCLESMGAGITLGVDLNGVTRYPKPDSWYDVVGNAIDIGMDLRTREQLEDADIVVSMDLAKYNRLDNSEQSEALFKEGYEAFRQHIGNVHWHSRVNLLFYVIKAIKELAPLKTPLVLQHVIEKYHDLKRSPK